MDTQKVKEREGTKKFASEWSISLTGSIFSIIVNYVTIAVATRFLAPKLFGLYALGLSVVNLALIPTLFGMNSVLSRYIPYFNALGSLGKSKMLIRKILLFNLFLSALAVVTLLFGVRFLATHVFQKPELASVLQLMVFAIPLIVFTEDIAFIFIGFKEIRYQVYTRKFVQPVARLLFGSLLLYMGYGIYGWLWTYLLSFLIGALLAGWFFKKHILVRFKNIEAERFSHREVGSYALLLGIYLALQILFSQLDIIFLGIFSTPEEIAAYHIYLYLATSLALMQASVVQIYKSYASELYATQNIQKIKKLYQKIAKWVFTVNAFAFLIIFFLGSDIIRIMFSESYLIQPVSLMIMVSGFFIASVAGPWDVTLQAFGTKRLWLINITLMLVFRTIICWALIPSYGILGAAISSAVTGVFGITLVLSELYVLYKIQPLTKSHLRFFGPIALTVAGYYLVGNRIHFDNLFNLFFILGLLTILYFTAIYLFGCLAKEDRIILRQVLLDPFLRVRPKQEA